jgi:hypothetical protein
MSKSSPDEPPLARVIEANCSPAGSTRAIVGAFGCAWTASGTCRGGARATGTGIGAVPVAIDCAITVMPPRAPTVSTAEVAAVLVQFIAPARRTATSADGSGTSWANVSYRFSSSGGTELADTQSP